MLTTKLDEALDALQSLQEGAGSEISMDQDGLATRIARSVSEKLGDLGGRIDEKILSACRELIDQQHHGLCSDPGCQMCVDARVTIESALDTADRFEQFRGLIIFSRCEKCLGLLELFGLLGRQGGDRRRRTKRRRGGGQAGEQDESDVEVAHGTHFPDRHYLLSDSLINRRQLG